MRKTLFTLCIALCALISSAQSFEGKIVYQNTLKSKAPGLSDQQLTTMMGNIQNYYVKGGSYKSETNGTFILWQLYVNADNKLYNKLASSETILWNDGATNEDPVISADIHKGVAELLGYKCDELVLTCKSGVQKYYFNSKFAIDSKLYANHQYGNWYTVLSKTNAIPLKIIIDNPQFSLESVATEIKAMPLAASFFALPAGVKTAKSPY